MATLNLMIDREIDGPALETGGAIADVWSMGPAEGAAPMDRTDIPVPAGTGTGAHVDNLPPGQYIVQLRFPSGERMTQPVRLESDSVSLTLTFRPAASQHEWLSWESYLGQFAALDADRPPKIEKAPPPTPRLSLDEAAPEVDQYAARGDDLTRIRGIGPKLEAEFNRRGVNRIAQVARFSTRELGWFSAEVKSARSSVSRFDLVAEAQRQSGAADLSAAPRVEADPTPAPDSFEIEIPGEPAMRVFVTDASGQAPSCIWPALDDMLRKDHQRNVTLVELAQSFQVPDIVETAAPITPAAGIGGSVTVMRVPSHTGNADHHGRRAYGLLHDGILPWLIALPVPWPVVDDGSWADVMVTIDRSNPLRSSVDVVPRDGTMADLLAFLRRGDMRAATTLLAQARDRLFGKVSNPLAAAAGGLVLVQARRWLGESRGPDLEAAMQGDLGTWLSNLRDWNPWLLDGAILSAWKSLLDAPDEIDGPRDDLLKAASGGLPLYTGSFRLLVDGLRAIDARLKKEERADPEIAAVLKRLDLSAMRVDMRQVFTTIRLTDRPMARDFGL